MPPLLALGGWETQPDKQCLPSLSTNAHGDYEQTQNRSEEQGNVRAEQSESAFQVETLNGEVEGKQRKFERNRRSDKNNNGSLDRTELVWVLKENGNSLTNTEIDRLFKYFDKNCDSKIALQEFMDSFRNEMTPARLQIVEDIFDQLSQGAPLKLAELLGHYNCNVHPEVRSGKRKPGEIIRALEEAWSGYLPNAISPVTRELFTEFYQDVSTFFDQDREFINVLRNSWICP